MPRPKLRRPVQKTPTFAELSHPDDLYATRLVQAAKSGAAFVDQMPPEDIVRGALYLNKVRAEQSLVIRQLKASLASHESSHAMFRAEQQRILKQRRR